VRESGRPSARSHQDFDRYQRPRHVRDRYRRSMDDFISSYFSPTLPCQTNSRPCWTNNGPIQRELLGRCHPHGELLFQWSSPIGSSLNSSNEAAGFIRSTVATPVHFRASGPSLRSAWSGSVLRVSHSALESLTCVARVIDLPQSCNTRPSEVACGGGKPPQRRDGIIWRDCLRSI
jgi:hypothetical protein